MGLRAARQRSLIEFIVDGDGGSQEQTL